MLENEKQSSGTVTPDEKKPEIKIPTIETKQKEQITLDEFNKMSLQMGEILSCEEVKDSK